MDGELVDDVVHVWEGLGVQLAPLVGVPGQVLIAAGRAVDDFLRGLLAEVGGNPDDEAQDCGDGIERLPRVEAELADRFARAVGRPPMQYLGQVRMQRAEESLASSAATVSAVAREVGFGSEAAFSRAFKRATGLAPSLWREAH